MSEQRDLGKLIFDANPYTSRMNIYPLQENIEDYYPEKIWLFEGQEQQIRRAVRIKYTYQENGQQETDYLIVLYEGTGAG